MSVPPTPPPSRKLRIATVCREIPPVGGGAGAVALQLSQELVRAGHEVDLYTMAFGDAPLEETIGGVRVFRVPSRRRHETHSRLAEMVLFVTRTRRALRRRHVDAPYDVIHAHSILPEGLIASFPGHAARIVLTAHGSDVPGYNPDRYSSVHRLSGPLWRRTLRRADVVTSPSAHLAGLIRAAQPDADVTVIPNGIDADLFEPATRRSGILIVTRLVPRKNVHIALEALRGLPATTVDVVGDGPELERLRDIAMTLPEHRVRFHGWLEHGSPPWREIYERNRFFVFMSAQENFPVSLLEAQLAGLVTIASDIPSNREVLGEAADFVPVDVSTLRSRLDGLMQESPQELALRGSHARKRVLDNFLWPEIATSYVAQYVHSDFSEFAGDS